MWNGWRTINGLQDRILPDFIQRNRASQQQGQAAANQVAQEGQQAIANFKKAMSACLEGKNYTVR